ncbi:MAG: hypothetical protein WC008_00550 [Bacilli bacterium]
MNKVITETVNGKIYIAGEYAVLFNNPAIIFPIDKKVTVKVSLNNENILYSHKYHSDFVKLNLFDEDKEVIYINKTIEWINQYLHLLNKTINKYKLEIISELDNNKNIKYGYGSSGAIIVALLKAILKINNINYDQMMLFKMAVLIQSSISKNTSYGDIACIVFNEKIYYKKFRINLETLKSKNIIDQLNTDWIGLIIKPIYMDINFLIVHTNHESKSYDLASRVINFKEHTFFKDFIKTSNKLVHNLIEDFNIRDIDNLHNNFLFLEQNTGVTLITEQMEHIRMIVNSFNGVMKFSGAGGGDMVVCFFKNNHSLLESKKELEIKGFECMVYGGIYES